MLGRYCGFTKKDIYELTLPQLERYMVHCKRNIKFEFEASSNSVVHAVAKIFGKDDKPAGTSVEESEASEDDINMLSKLLGGGM